EESLFWRRAVTIISVNTIIVVVLAVTVVLVNGQEGVKASELDQAILLCGSLFGTLLFAIPIRLVHLELTVYGRDACNSRLTYGIRKHAFLSSLKWWGAVSVYRLLYTHGLLFWLATVFH